MVPQIRSSPTDGRAEIVSRAVTLPPLFVHTMDAVPDQLNEQIRGILGLHARLHVDPPSLRDKDDLFQAGMSSHANVTVMLALEDTFGIEFPDSMLRRETFQSVSSIQEAISQLLPAPEH